MKKLFLSITLILLCSFAFSSETADFNGKTIREINIKTSRISPKMVRKKFLMQEGEVFFKDSYDYARQALHDMRIFKSIDFDIAENEDNTLSINIDAKDGYFILPMIFGTGGNESMLAVALMEANIFKAGEMFSIFGSFSSDGFLTMALLGIENNLFSIGYNGMEFEESVYKNGSYSTSGMFSSDSKRDKSGKPLNSYDIKSDGFVLSWSRLFYEKTSISLAFNTSYIQYKGNNTPDDEGRHNKMIFSIKNFKNAKEGDNVDWGALFGIGQSGIADKLAALPKKKFGYSVRLTYENGGDYIGSDYDISRISLNFSGNIEFKTRNTLFLNITAAKGFESKFNDRIKSIDTLSGKGIYSKMFRCDEAIGGGLSFAWYPIKNKTGVLSIVPFIENAILWDNSSIQNHGGAGTIISYRMWRIPFPLGINFTQNLNDRSNEVSFVFGGGF
ncbi:MAG: hypothetical protein LBD46_06295 [Endomicrobium sp.]|jgi:outer membrane protein assembly factor BamA|nr:hypothetical protein [Endomicrobium sp.]